MNTPTTDRACGQTELACAYALQALPADEIPVIEAHIANCAECRREVESLRPVVESFANWPSDVLRPPGSLWDRLSDRIAPEASKASDSAAWQWSEPEWEDVAPGIACKLLATDADGDHVSMLVRLAPGAAYPPHSHAGVEELHLLHGELWIEDRKLRPGDFNRAEPGTSDDRVWTETGCTCVLITSSRDALR
ncbi:MAG: cupin domain-containing protein [Steroidobacteraceae bacterium]